MTKIDLDPTATLVLPPLEMVVAASDVGKICHNLDLVGERSILSEETISVSARTKEKAYNLSDGSKVIVTGRAKLNRPDGVDGVLHIDTDRKLTWLSHGRLDHFQKEISNKGLSVIAQEIAASWNGNFRYAMEVKNSEGEILSRGLRPPQIGGLHAIGSHWSLYTQPATVK